MLTTILVGLAGCLMGIIPMRVWSVYLVAICIFSGALITYFTGWGTTGLLGSVALVLVLEFSYLLSAVVATFTKKRVAIYKSSASR